MNNRVDYKELLKQKLHEMSAAAESMQEIEAAYQAGRLDALLATKQMRAAVNQQAEQ